MIIKSFTFCQIALIFVTIFFYGCRNDFDAYFNAQAWTVDSLYLNNSKYINNISCYKSEIISFPRDQSMSFTPGFKKPIDQGKCEYNKELKAIIFTDVEECFFQDTFYYEVDYARPNYLKLQSSKITVICSRIQIQGNGLIGPPILRRFLDKESWGSEKCKEFRKLVCPEEF